MTEQDSLVIRFKKGIIFYVIRLLVSNILIENMTGSNTELAKNLILAGANITIVDASIIGERDTDTNFIFTK